eukprot:symbB.v1.2.029280.t1/scaffold3187.1/size61690/5
MKANHFKLNHGMGSNLMSSLVLAPIGLKEVELIEVRLLQEERSANAYPGLVFVEREHVISARAEDD